MNLIVFPFQHQFPSLQSVAGSSIRDKMFGTVKTLPQAECRDLGNSIPFMSERNWQELSPVRSWASPIARVLSNPFFAEFRDMCTAQPREMNSAHKSGRFYVRPSKSSSSRSGDSLGSWLAPVISLNPTDKNQGRRAWEEGWPWNFGFFDWSRAL